MVSATHAALRQKVLKLGQKGEHGNAFVALHRHRRIRDGGAAVVERDHFPLGVKDRRAGRAMLRVGEILHPLVIGRNVDDPVVLQDDFLRRTGRVLDDKGRGVNLQ